MWHKVPLTRLYFKILEDMWSQFSVQCALTQNLLLLDMVPEQNHELGLSKQEAK